MLVPGRAIRSDLGAMKTQLLLLLTLLTGCATMAGMRTEPLDAGVAKHYAANLQQAVTATRNALLGSALEIDDVERVDEATWMFLAKRKSGNWTYGELVRVVVHETTAGEVTVRILSKRRNAINVTARSDWSDAVFAQLALELDERQRVRLGQTRAVDAPALVVHTVAIRPAEGTLVVDAQLQLAATAYSPRGAAIPNRGFVWSSSNDAIASVSNAGLVTAHARGAVVIAANSDSIVGTATIVVEVP